MGKYDDIIDLPYPISAKRSKMTVSGRAAQFSPFAALTGYGDAVAETARLTEKKRDIDYGMKEIISDKLQIISSFESESPEIVMCFFVEDEKKDGGEYKYFTGVIRFVDNEKKEILLEDERRIKIDTIYSIEGQIFERFGY